MPALHDLFVNDNEQGNDNTEKYHSRNGEIKPEIVSFNPDIAGQPADPVQLIVKEINKHPDNYNRQSGDNDILARFTVHNTKLRDLYLFEHL